MNNSKKKMRNMTISHIIRAKHLLRIPLLLHHIHYLKPKALAAAAGNNPNSNDDSSVKALLIVGELSNGHCQWRNLAVQQVPPKGFLAVYVGPELRRFIIPASYLTLPDFRVLLDRVAEEFGYEQEGGLMIPCEEEDFENILTRCVVKHQKQ